MRHDQHDEQERHGQQDVDDTHHDGVDDAADQAGHGAPQGADDAGDEGGQEADLQRGLATEHDPAEDVEAVVIGAEGVARLGPHVGVVQVRNGLLGVVEHRAQEAEQHEEHQDADTGHRQLVAGELLEGELPAGGCGFCQSSGVGLGGFGRGRDRRLKSCAHFDSSGRSGAVLAWDMVVDMVVIWFVVGVIVTPA